ncbi:MAG: siphovirus Gp157 family protein [Fusobacterium necrophorum]|nr:siphovirus Gp157 family protein [Fusobacterium necrophorum]
MKLYEIREDLLETLDLLCQNSEEELAKENCQEMLCFLKEQLKEKSNSILKYIRNLESEKGMIVGEVERLEKLRKKKESSLAFLKKYLVQTMLDLEEKKIETDIGSYGIRKSTKVEVIDMNRIPSEFIKVKEEKTIDKISIGNYLKEFGELPGARMVESYSLQIR